MFIKGSKAIISAHSCKQSGKLASRHNKELLFSLLGRAYKAHIAITGGAVQLDGVSQEQVFLPGIAAAAFPAAFRTGQFVPVEDSVGKYGMHDQWLLVDEWLDQISPV